MGGVCMGMKGVMKNGDGLNLRTLYPHFLNFLGGGDKVWRYEAQKMREELIRGRDEKS